MVFRHLGHPPEGISVFMYTAAHIAMSKSKNHPCKGFVVNLSWARVLASAAPHIASNKCASIVDASQPNKPCCSTTSTAHGQEQQSLDVACRQLVGRMVNRLRSEEYMDQQKHESKANAMSEAYRIAAEAAALHRHVSAAKSKSQQSISAGLQQASNSSSAGSLATTLLLERQLYESRSVRAAASELLGHSIRYCMLQ